MIKKSRKIKQSRPAFWFNQNEIGSSRTSTISALRYYFSKLLFLPKLQLARFTAPLKLPVPVFLGP